MNNSSKEESILQLFVEAADSEQEGLFFQMFSV